MVCGFQERGSLFSADPPDLDQVLDGRFADFLSRIKSTLVERIGQAYADTGKRDQRIIAHLHVLTVLTFTFDIQVPAGQFGCEPDILSLFADRNGEEIVRDDDLHGAVVLIDDDP